MARYDTLSIKGIFATTTALATLLIGSGDMAFAQDNSDEAERMEKVVVTGSRLQRSGLESPIPVTSLDSDDVAVSGAIEIGELINELPALAVGQAASRTTNQNSNGNIGTSLLNLRALGTNRTLVVVNGRRHVGALGGSTAVDLNTIPTALIKSIEISTGGASVAYGADAVSGVVNVVLNDKFEGVQLDLRGGQTDENDGASVYASLTAGGNFSQERGNAVFNLTYSAQEPINGADRDWLARQRVFVNNPLNTGPTDGIPANILVDNGRIGATNANGIFGGLFSGLVNPSNLTINDDGTLRQFDPGTNLGGSLVTGGDGFNLLDAQRVSNKVDRLLLSSDVNYALTGNTNFFVEGKFSRVEAQNLFQPTGDFFAFLDGDQSLFFIDPTNPFLPDDPALDALFAANPEFPTFFPTSAGRSTVVFSRFHSDHGVRKTETLRDTLRFATGFEGVLPSLGWNWDTYYQYGELSGTRIDRNNRDSRRYALSVDAVTDTLGITGVAPGSPACRSTVNAFTASGGAPTGNPDIDDCLPINLFVPGGFDPAALDYFQIDPLQSESVSQQVFSANLSGALYELPAGDLTFAIGTEWREETSSITPAPIQVQGNTFDGDTQPLDGRYDVLEGYVEVGIPLLKDLPFVKSLGVEGGVRLSDYSTVGSTTAWRANAEWAPIDQLRFRAGVAESVRAPNISELFAVRQGGFGSVQDPCDVINQGLGVNPALRTANCASDLGALGLDPSTFSDPLSGVTKSLILGGNPELAEETAETFTVGFVWQPSWIEGLSFTADYFDVEISNAVSTLSPQQIVNNCYDQFSSIDNEFCTLFSRRSNGLIIDVEATNINVASIETKGVDFEVNYEADIESLFGVKRAPWGDPGTIGLQVIGTYLDELNVLASPDASIDRDAGEIGSPKWRTNVRAQYSSGPFDLNWTLRYLGDGIRNVQDEILIESFDRFTVDEYYVSDIQASYMFEDVGIADQLQLYAGINNLFDQDPPDLANSGQSSLASTAQYDTIGRFMFVGVSTKF